MQFLKNFYQTTLKYDLINKFSYKKTQKIPKLKKVVLSFEAKTTRIEQLASSLLALEIITNQRGLLTKAKKSNVLIKIWKGDPVGCKVVLWRENLFNFLEKFINRVVLETKTFPNFELSKKITKNSYSFDFQDNFSFPELASHYYFFQNLPKLNVTVVATTHNKQELTFLLKSLKFPFKK